MPIITIKKEHAHLVLDGLSNCQLMFKIPPPLKINRSKDFAIKLSCLEKASPILHDLSSKEIDFTLWEIDFTLWDDQNFTPLELPKLTTFKSRYKPKPQSNKNQYYSIFGEQPRTLSAIAKDPRCKVSLATLRQRVLMQKIPVERAMLLSPNTVKQRRQVMFELNGVVKSLKEWSEDKICAVPFPMLQSRIFKLGWTLEEALTTPPSNDVKEKITAFLDSLQTSKANPPVGFNQWSSRAIACHLGIPSSYKTVARILRKECDDIVV